MACVHVLNLRSRDYLDFPFHVILSLIRIGPDRAYPLHFTRPQLLLPVLPVLLPLLCVCEITFEQWN